MDSETARIWEFTVILISGEDSMNMVIFMYRDLWRAPTSRTDIAQVTVELTRDTLHQHPAL